MRNQNLLNSNKQFEFLDILNVASFYLGILNLNQNLNQTDKQEIENKLNDSLAAKVQEIHAHLQEQDNKINKIMEALHLDY